MGKTSTLSIRTLLILIAGVVAAWSAAGSLGWLAPALQKVICWLAMIAAGFAAWPWRPDARTRRLAVLAASAVVAAVLTALSSPAVNIVAVVVMLAAIAETQMAASARAVRTAAWAVLALAAYRLAVEATGIGWTIADRLGGLLGAAALRSSDIGASFAGVDFLVLMAALTVGWLMGTDSPRWPRGLRMAGAILAAHFLYLIVLMFLPELCASLPSVVQPTITELSKVGVWTWGNALHAVVPWNLPVLAAVFQIVVLVLLFRRTAWISTAAPSADASPLYHFGPAALAVVAALALAPTATKPTLAGRSVLVYDGSSIDWSVAESPTAAARTMPKFGLLPLLVESLGGKFTRSAELTENDLAAADLLVMLAPYPGSHGPEMPEAVQERIDQFVWQGGAVLVASQWRAHGSPTDGFQAMLDRWGFRLDARVNHSATSHWEHNCQSAPHAATVGIDTGHNGFGFDRPVAIHSTGQAVPLVASRWATANVSRGLSQFSFDENGTVPLGENSFVAGDRLGDVALAAEQRVGRGSVVVLGDVNCLANDRLPSSYVFVGRLLAALAAKSGGPLAFWRQAVALLALGAMLVLAARQTEAMQLSVAAMAMAAAVFGGTIAADATAELLPDGRPQSNPPIAYVDASHLEPLAYEPWSPDGLGQLTRALARGGHLPLLAPDLSPQRLQGAAMLLLIAPARPLSAGERKTVHEFVDGGGILICMVGSEEIGPSGPLLAEFDLAVPPMPVPPSEITRETFPIGAFAAAYGDSSNDKSAAWFYAAWPIVHGQDAEDLVAWSDSRQYMPVITSKRFGKGTVVLVGDTYFAMNKNMELLDKDPAANTEFWQWLLTRLTGRLPAAQTTSKAKPAELKESGAIELPDPGRTDVKEVKP
jgi:hypothetical protein